MRNNRGFTLIELLMVIAIIGVVTAIAIPNYMGFRSRTRLQTACREMTTIFQFARAQAIGSNEAWRVHLDPAGNRYFLLDGSSSIYQTIDLEHHRGISFGSNNPTPIDKNHVVRIFGDRKVICVINDEIDILFKAQHLKGVFQRSVILRILVNRIHARAGTRRGEYNRASAVKPADFKDFFARERPDRFEYIRRLIKVESGDAPGSLAGGPGVVPGRA